MQRYWKKYPNWENPVRAWAEANGMNLLPPTEMDDSYSSRPAISITSPTNNATVDGNITISSNVSSSQGVSDVQYYLGDAQIGSNSSSPYSVGFDTTKYSNGSYKLTAKMSDSNGVGAENSIQITIQNGSAPKINDVNVSGITANSAIIGFSTDVAADSTVYYGTSTSYDKNVSAGGSVSHSATLPALTGATRYYFKIVASYLGKTSNYEGSFNTL